MNDSTPLPLSVVIICQNAARTLSRTLASVAEWVDEIILVDSGSTDGTLSIACRYKCRIAFRRFDGYGPQKSFAVKLSRNPWVMVLDADEEVSGELAAELQQGFRSWIRHYQGFTVPRNQFFLGQPLRYSGQYRVPVLRIFNRNYGGITPLLTGEEVVVGGKLMPLRAPLLHYNCETLAECLTQLNTRLTFSAQEQMRFRPKETLPGQVFHFFISFFRLFIFRRGYKDGLKGFIWTLLSALEPVLAYQRYMEVKAQKRSRQQSTFVFTKPVPKRKWYRRYPN